MLKEAHAILGYYPAAEGLDLEVQKLGDGGYRSLNVVIVNASARSNDSGVSLCEVSPGITPRHKLWAVVKACTAAGIKSSLEDCLPDVGRAFHKAFQVRPHTRTRPSHCSGLS